MSRSYKKYPCVKDRNPFSKKRANRLVRRSGDVPQNKGYRKVFDSYTICDYIIYESEADMKREWEDQDSFLRRRHATYKEAYRTWYKNCKAK